MYYNNYNLPYNNGYYQQSNQTFNNSNQQYSMGLKGRPVSSLEEVRAAQIDFDGSLFVFPDVANKKVYTKQINLDGTASVKIYSLCENAIPTPQYVTKEELDAIIGELQNKIGEKKDEQTNIQQQSNTTSSNRAAITF